jgi:uncharacterized membrane protein YcaP (DUF421 family)
MAGEYRSVTDGFVLVSTLLGWNVLIDWLAFRFPALQPILEPSPLLLVRNGRLVHDHLRREHISEDELRSKLREHEVEDPAEVAQAYLEPDGEVSVLKKRA